jgi:hypothetical protein
VPAVTDNEHVAPQLIPAGLVTVPVPAPVFEIDSVTVVAAVPVPLTLRETVSEPPVNTTFDANVPVVVGWNRTVTVWLAPEARVNGEPDTTLNGAATVAVPEMLAPLVFCTVNVRSTAVPVVTLPKLVAPAGVTPKLPCATPLAAGEHALSFPDESTAVMRAKYVVLAVSPVTTVLAVWPDDGVVVDDGTVRNGVPGHAGELVPK